MRPLVAACLLLASTAPLFADDPKPSVDPPAGVELDEREQAFRDLLANVRMKGSYTVAGRERGGAPKEDSYEISRATKVSGDNWIVLARAKWGDNDITLPFPVRVVWAEDTPMITLTDVGFPGLGGKFSARVLFHDKWYAGTWKHDQVGGHMFGTIEPITQNGAPQPPQGTRKPPAPAEKPRE